jgi:dienelactone hydrolase
MNLGKFCVGLHMTLWALVAHAQYGTPASLKAELPPGNDLTFSSAAQTTVDMASMGNALYAPPGVATQTAQKHPALILFHTCSGISQHIQYWTQEALKEGYVVLTPNGMRGIKADCGSPSKIPNARLIKDALDGAAHLAQLPYVDAQRIAVVGFSKGAFVATWLSSPSVVQAIASNAPRPAAYVGLYGFCGLPPTKGRPQGIVLLQPDTDRPLLMLMGAQDTETPPDSCLAMLPELQQNKAPVQWHLYPNATHCWDCKDLDGFSKTAPTTNLRVTYRFDPAITQDSRERVFGFLKKALGEGP